MTRKDAAAPIAAKIAAWQKRHGRRDLPWQCADAYRVWLSEVMLQQTRVAAVTIYYQKFIRRFPNIRALAAADLEAVLTQWSGLGYYARARNLHRAARLIREKYGGEFPRRYEDIRALPGVGDSTAAAICVFARRGRRAILDGNVKRVFARVFNVAAPINEPATIRALQNLAEENLPRRDLRAYTQGLMDLGAMVCIRRNPKCDSCPLAAQCEAHKQGRENELPVKKRPAKKPTRYIQIAVIARGDKKIFLLKRPESGVWGGLWSLPEFDDAKTTAQIKRECENISGIKKLSQARGKRRQEQKNIAPIKHGFTHFNLVAKPLFFFAQENAAKSSAESPIKKKWLGKRAVGDAALPAPIKNFLRRDLPI